MPVEDITKVKDYKSNKAKGIRELMEADPNLSLAEASGIFMARLRELSAKKRELLNDFAPELVAKKKREAVDKMMHTVSVNKKQVRRKMMADMDILERAEFKRRERKGLPPLKDNIVAPLNKDGLIPYSAVLNNIDDAKKPTHIKDAFIETFNTLQLPENEPFSLTAWAKMNPSQFYLLVTKLIPQQTPDEKNAPLQIKSITFE